MQFLAPIFLAGLAALAIPVIIHLTHRERDTPVRFPSLMFLRRIPYRTRRRQRIRHWLLFLLRAAAVALITLAFARPLLRGAAAGAPSGEAAREVVVLVDRSMSMSAGDRWDRAVAAARTVLNALSPRDRATLVLFAERAEAVGPTHELGTLVAALEQARPIPAATRYGAAFRLAADLLATSDLPRREVVLVADFQRSGTADLEATRLPSGTSLAVISVADGEPTNLAVTDVLLDRGRGADRSRLAVGARIVNTGSEDQRGVTVALEVNDAVLRSVTVNVPARSTVPVSFPAVAAPTGAVRGRVTTGGDRLAGDDAFHFVAAPVEPVRVLLVEASGAPAGISLYLERALAIGDHPPFSVDTRRGVPEPATLEQYDIVISNDAQMGRGGGALRAFVEQGGGLFAILGARASGRPLVSAFPELIAGAAGPVDRLAEGGATLSVVAFDHPVFEAFRAPRSGDFSTARFYRYRRLDLGNSASTLARFDDGAPAILEAPIGSGRAMAVATGLENSWNDLPLQPVFLPLVQRAARHLADWAEEPISYVAGSALDLAMLAESIQAVDELAVDAPSGGTTVLGVRGAAVQLDEAGFYTIRTGPSASGGALIAVNPPIEESDLTAVDSDELVTAVSAPPAEVPTAAGGPEVPLGAAEMERRQALWWYFLLIAGLILGIESILANRRRGEATILASGGT
jgi:hypothetical protein